MVRKDMKQGYGQEEAYFYRVNKELIERKRKELDAKKDSMAEQQRNPYWMRCPKCGSGMKEVDLTGIKVDRCTACHGIYFDSGELQILLESKAPKGFFGVLKKLF